MRSRPAISKNSFRLLDVANEYLLRKKMEVGKDLRSTTFRTYEIRLKNLVLFLKKNKLTNISLNKIDENFLDEFKLYLRHDKGNSWDHIRRVISQVKQIIDYAELKKYTKENSIQHYKLKRSSPKPLIFLSDQQLDRLMHYLFASPNLREVADLFKFQCWTGVAYCDLMKFSIDNLEREEQLNWINYNRYKTKNCNATAILPLLPEAEEILIKYNYQLPYYSNAIYNKLLKEIAAIIGFHQNLTTHVGRKTFGMTMLNNGISLEVVSKMLGHKSIRTTQECYAEILKKRVKNEMKPYFQQTTLQVCKLIVLR